MERLRELRKNQRLTLREVSGMLNISISCYSNYEQGLREPNLNMVRQICKLFHVSADYLIGLENVDGSKNY